MALTQTINIIKPFKRNMKIESLNEWKRWIRCEWNEIIIIDGIYWQNAIETGLFSSLSFSSITLTLSFSFLLFIVIIDSIKAMFYSLQPSTDNNSNNVWWIEISNLDNAKAIYKRKTIKSTRLKQKRRERKTYTHTHTQKWTVILNGKRRMPNNNNIEADESRHREITKES